jgi:hypothetical protein
MGLTFANLNRAFLQKLGRSSFRISNHIGHAIQFSQGHSAIKGQKQAMIEN